MRRGVKALVAIPALCAALLVAGCTKPAPELTIQSGSFSTTVSPTTYTFGTAADLHSYRPSLPEITASTGGTVLIDVPRQVVGNGWEVDAMSLTDLTKSIGGSGPINDRHTYRVAAQTNNGNAFVVKVLQLNHGKPDGSIWSFLVKVDNGT